MNFRCYSCGTVFHEGLPPMEALSDQQASLVGAPRVEVTDFAAMLLGTVFEGMTPANFCDVCLLALVDNPTSFRPDNTRTHELEQTLEAVWCRCGVTYATRQVKSRMDAILGGFDWVEINRLKMRHISDS